MTTDAATHAVRVVAAATERRFDEIVDGFAPALRPMVTAATLQAAWDAATDQLGAVTGVGEPVEEPAASGGALVKVPVTFTEGGITVLVSLAGKGELVGIQLAPPSAMAKH